MSRIRWGMVGGGNDAFIGGVHRIAARIDNRFDLVAGALSSTPEKSATSAKALGISRSYASFAEMAETEAAREDGIEAVSIVTPNHVHAAAAQAFLEKGIHVICDKPLSSAMEDAAKMAQAVASSDALFVLTHNYTGYPMIRQSRAMIAAGELGEIRIVQAEYPQDWLTTPMEGEGLKQAEWRTDPERSGAGGCVGDIGTHAHNLACFVTELRATSLSATLSSHVAGRLVDDDARITLQFEGGARGHIWASQVASGNENNLTLAVYGSKGSLRWAQENPNVLWFSELGKAPQMLTRGGGAANAAATAVTRIPAGHPEGYLEAFATLYREAAEVIISGDRTSVTLGIQDGLDGVRLVDACQRSSEDGASWIELC